MTTRHVRPYPVLCTGGTYAVRFSDRGGQVRNFSLGGTYGKSDAAKVATEIARILDADAVNDELPPKSRAWLEKIPASWRSKLTALGVIDGTRAASLDPLTQHFKAWSDSLRAKSPRRADDVLRILTQFAEKSGITQLSRIDLRTADRVFGKMETDTDAPHTIRKHQQVLKQFCSWAVRQGLLAASPVAEMKGVSGGTERERRSLSLDEIHRLLAYAASASDQIWRDRLGRIRNQISGAERALVYRVVLESGLRLGELCSLTRDSFRLAFIVNGKAAPCMQLKAKDEKNRRGSTLPLRAATAEMIREHISHKLPGLPVFAMPKRDEAAEMIRRDLAGARSAWIKEARTPAERLDREKSSFLAEKDDAKAVIDFHALRVTFITNLARGGVPVQIAVKLARHSDPKLTIGIYTKAGALDTDDALARLPDLDHSAVTAAVTGTHD
jgi:integrase